MPEHYYSPSPAKGSPHIFVATPTTHIHANHMASIARALPILMGTGCAVDHFLLDGLCHVDDARNICVGKFLETSCDALIFIDADVGFPPEALNRLARLQGDVVAGVYPRREMRRSWPFKTEEGVTLDMGEDGVVRNGVLGLPTGFMKISRHVLDAMSREEPQRIFRPFGDADIAAPIIFERTFVNGERLSGDYAFCKKVRDLGYELALDPTPWFSHAGEFAFKGRLMDDLAPPPEESANDAE